MSRTGLGTVLVLGVVASACATPGPPPPPICDGLLRPTSESVGSAYEFGLENGCVVPVTIEMTFPKLENMRADRELPIRAVIPARSKARLTRVETVNVYEKASCQTAFSVLYLGSSAPAADAAAVYEFPFAGSESRVLVQGAHGSVTHQDRHAYDFGMPIGTPIVAAREGTVVQVIDRFGEGGFSRRFLNSSNSVLVLHRDGTMAKYGHLLQGIPVKVGAPVAAGDLLGSSGNSGYSKGPHLHFEVIAQTPGGAGDSIPIRFRGADVLSEGRSYGPFRGATAVGAK